MEFSVHMLNCSYNYGWFYEKCKSKQFLVIKKKTQFWLGLEYHQDYFGNVYNSDLFETLWCNFCWFSLENFIIFLSTLQSNSGLNETISWLYRPDDITEDMMGNVSAIINTLGRWWDWSSNQINSLWPSDTIWWHRSRSTLAQVMACCLTPPSHYLNQCWLIVSTDQWHLSKGNFIRHAPAINHKNQLKFAQIKLLSKLAEANELMIFTRQDS